MKQKMPKEKKKLIWSLILLLGGNLLLFLLIWLLNKYDNIYLDQILFQIKSPAVGTNKNLLSSAYIRVGLFGVLLTALEVFLYRILSGYSKKLKAKQGYIEYCSKKVCAFFKKTALPFALATLLLAVSLFITKLKVVPYIDTVSEESDFIKEHYVAPTNEVLTFPQQKKNLIYIFLESMETTYTSSADGGAQIENYIPELTLLAKENVSFSNTNRLGGALPFSGTTWTAAAMVAQTSGISIKVPLTAENYGGENSFLPGITSIGEVLEQNGYEQTLLIGSDAAFAARDSYFSDNGNYNIVDINVLKAEGRLDEDYRVWWGYEDARLFEYAKEELAKLHETGKPFNFTMLTADTHFPDGYFCEKCPVQYKEQYANVLSCSSKQVYEFVEWLKTQPYYNDTTIIISGDHLTMDPQFLKDVDEQYTRTVYNCIINSSVNPIKTTNRLFGTFDMFPTTLSAMGVRIEGDRLGLGTDLFSASETLTEMYGFTQLNEELQKKSLYYNETFVGMKPKEEKN